MIVLAGMEHLVRSSDVSVLSLADVYNPEFGCGVGEFAAVGSEGEAGGGGGLCTDGFAGWASDGGGIGVVAGICAVVGLSAATVFECSVVTTRR